MLSEVTPERETQGELVSACGGVRVRTRPGTGPPRGGSGSKDRNELDCTTVETPEGQLDGFFSQLPFKCYLPEGASVGD